MSNKAGRGLIGSFGGTKEKSSLFEKKIGRFLVVQEVSKLLLMIVLSCAKYDNFPPKMVSTWQVLSQNCFENCQVSTYLSFKTAKYVQVLASSKYLAEVSPSLAPRI